MKSMLFCSVVLSVLVAAGCSSTPTKKGHKEDNFKASLPQQNIVKLPFFQDQVWSGYYVCAQGKTELNLRIQNVSTDKVKTELGHAYDVTAVFEADFKNRTVVAAFHLLGKYYPEKGVAVFDPSSWIRKPPGNWETVGMDGLISDNGKTYSGTIQHSGCGKFQVSLNE